jgi:hypothetical protein
LRIVAAFPWAAPIRNRHDTDTKPGTVHRQLVVMA